MTFNTNPPQPLLPDYDGACTSNILGEIAGALAGRPTADWFPIKKSVQQIVLFVIDGLGWEQLHERSHVAPLLSSMSGGPITTIAPSTTPAALTSITSGTTPSEHGILGFRLTVAPHENLEVIHWTIDRQDARRRIDPDAMRARPAFPGVDASAVIRERFLGGGFTRNQFADTPLVGYTDPAEIPRLVSEELSTGRPLVYAYYDGLDTEAHISGLHDAYEEQLRFVDDVASRIAASLPPDAALLVTADHGHVEVGDNYLMLDDAIVDLVDHFSGESRFRWLHAKDDRVDELYEVCKERLDHLAWIATFDDVIADNWFGGYVNQQFATRLGDVAIAPFAPVAFVHPEAVDRHLPSRHGSFTSAEMLVPLIARHA